MTGLEVLDSAVKIGLGALISAVSGYLVLRKNHDHENEKEKRQRWYDLQNEKKICYVEFLTLSERVMQDNLFTSMSLESQDYKSYINSYNKLQIISNDEMRSRAYSAKDAVIKFAILNKNNGDIELEGKMVNEAREKVGYFQKLAQIEVTTPYVK